MKIDIKKSKKPIKYLDAIDFLEKRAEKVYKKESKELIWVLEHPPTFTSQIMMYAGHPPAHSIASHDAP